MLFPLCFSRCRYQSAPFFNGDISDVGALIFALIYFITGPFRQSRKLLTVEVVQIMTAVISGIIIDSFGELRSNHEQIVDERENRCFICSHPRSLIESNTKIGLVLSCKKNEPHLFQLRWSRVQRALSLELCVFLDPRRKICQKPRDAPDWVMLICHPCMALYIVPSGMN